MYKLSCLSSTRQGIFQWFPALLMPKFRKEENHTSLSVTPVDHIPGLLLQNHLMGGGDCWIGEGDGIMGKEMAIDERK